MATETITPTRDDLLDRARRVFDTALHAGAGMHASVSHEDFKARIDASDEAYRALLRAILAVTECAA